MRRFAAGLACCALGVLLYAVNWLGATVHVLAFDGANESQLSQAYRAVGRQPLTIGIVLFVLGVLLMIWSAIPAKDAGTTPN